MSPRPDRAGDRHPLLMVMATRFLLPVALMIGGTGFMVTRNRLVRTFWACWPLLVAWVTVVTGNHYWIDILLGWAVAVGAFLIASQVIARIDPESWGLKPVLAARRNGFARTSRAGA